jgi:hypothetical protein
MAWLRMLGHLGRQADAGAATAVNRHRLWGKAGEAQLSLRFLPYPAR